jgi:hypothetical protein|tara:strand:- start:230 stop:454 length:225 start_codon:yes stop_codon:yes gene_type:complete
MSTEWLLDFESDLRRINKAEKVLRDEINTKIDQLRTLNKEKERIIDETLGNGTKSREDVEWDLLDLRLNGRKDE